MTIDGADVLTAAHVEAFTTDGVVHVSRAVDSNLIDEVLALADRQLAAPGLWVGALLAFARSLGEFGATITFVANIAGQTRTIPAAIYTFLNQPSGEDAALRLVWISVAVSLTALLGSEWSARRARGRQEMR